MKQTLRLIYLQSMLYRLELLGDCFVDSLLADSNANLIESKTKPNQQTLTDIKHRVFSCKLCSLSNMTDDRSRFCGILPKQEVCFQTQSMLTAQQTYVDSTNSKSQSQSTANNSLKIAFVLESLRLQQLGDSLDCLDVSQSNIMLTDIIAKAMGITLECAFIFPLFKCAALQNNKLSLMIQNNDLERERKICSKYLIGQLRFVDYAVFFGERLCRDFFNASLLQTKGKILQYSALGNVLHAVCVHDIMDMIINPSLKRETMTNLNMLKRFINAKTKLSSYQL